MLTVIEKKTENGDDLIVVRKKGNTFKIGDRLLDNTYRQFSLTWEEWEYLKKCVSVVEKRLKPREVK